LNLAEAIHARQNGDATLTAMLAIYRGTPAVFTIGPAPDDAEMPYTVSDGDTSSQPYDTKTTRGREVMRDVRCYAPASGSVLVVEAIAERVRTLFHRYGLEVDGYQVIVAMANGPTQANEPDCYGRVVSLRYILMEA
jgi:hypothetical protein